MIEDLTLAVLNIATSELSASAIFSCISEGSREGWSEEKLEEQLQELTQYLYENRSEDHPADIAYIRHWGICNLIRILAGVHANNLNLTSAYTDMLYDSLDMIQRYYLA